MNQTHDEISVKKRGRIAVKGKGDMVTYWVGDAEIEQAMMEKRQHEGQAQAQRSSSLVVPEQHPSHVRQVDFVDEPNSPIKGRTQMEQWQLNGNNDKLKLSPDRTWRQDLQTGLRSMDSSSSSPGVGQQQHQPQPLLSLPPLQRQNSAGLGSVKEAVHFVRRPSNDY